LVVIFHTIAIYFGYSLLPNINDQNIKTKHDFIIDKSIEKHPRCLVGTKKKNSEH